MKSTSEEGEHNDEEDLGDSDSIYRITWIYSNS